MNLRGVRRPKVAHRASTTQRAAVCPLSGQGKDGHQCTIRMAPVPQQCRSSGTLSAAGALGCRSCNPSQPDRVRV